MKNGVEGGRWQVEVPAGPDRAPASNSFLHPPPSTLHPQSSTLHPQPFTLHRLVLALSLALLVAGCGDEDSAGLLAARRGGLEVELALRGTLQAVQGASIKSPRGGEIKRMADNGSLVKAGEKVLELVDDDIEDDVREHRSQVDICTSELRQVEQEVASSNKWAEMRRDAARLDRELQQANVKELEARPTERELTDATSRLELARTLLAASQEAVGLVRDLVASGYAPQEDLRSAERDVLAARAELAAAESRLETVKAGPTASERQAAAVRLQAATIAERSAEKRIEVTGEWGRAKVARFTRRLDREKEKLAEVERRLAESVVACPADGVVLYAPRRWGGNWQTGQRVWPGATIMTVPNLAKMKVSVQVPAERVRELEKRKDLAAHVRVGALPGRIFSGTLTKVSDIGRDEFENLDPATAEKVGRAERQVFEAEVELDEEDGKLLPGCSAEVRLVLQQVSDAIIVPMAALTIKADAARPTAEKPSGAAARPTAGPPGAGTPEDRGGRRSQRGGREGRGRGERRTPQSALVYVRTDSGFEERTVRVLARNEYEAAVDGPVAAGDLLYPGKPAGFVRSAGEPAKDQTGTQDAPPAGKTAPSTPSARSAPYAPEPPAAPATPAVPKTPAAPAVPAAPAAPGGER